MTLTPQMIQGIEMVGAAILGFILFYLLLPILDKKFDLGKRIKTVGEVVDKADKALDGPIAHMLPYGAFIDNVAHLANIAVHAADQIYTAYDKAKKKDSAMDFIETAFNLARPGNPLTEDEKKIINNVVEAQVWAVKKEAKKIEAATPVQIKGEIHQALENIKRVQTPEIDNLVQDVEFVLRQAKLTQDEVISQVTTDNSNSSIESHTSQPGVSGEVLDDMVIGSVHVKEPTPINLTDTVSQLVEDPYRPGVWVRPEELNN